MPRSSRRSPNASVHPAERLPTIYTCFFRNDTPEPSPSPSAPTLDLKVDQPAAFSPNNDGTKDTIGLHVKASGPWTIHVDGRAETLASGTGDQDITWRGTPDNALPKALGGNGIILPDGTYALRLTTQGASPDPKDPTATVVIDTKVPKIESVDLASFKSQLQDRNNLDSVVSNYKFSVKVSDPLKNGSASGFSPDGISVDSSQAALAGTPSDLGNGSYEISLNTTSLAGKSLRFDVIATDRAGNRTKKSHSLRGSASDQEISVVQTNPDFQLAGSGAAVRRLLDTTSQGSTSFQGVYYSRSGLTLTRKQTFTFHYYQDGHEVIGRPGTTFLILTNRDHPQGSGVYQELDFKSGIPTPEVTITWDGKLPNLAWAPQGVYTLTQTDPDWVPTHKEFKLKVCDMPCVTTKIQAGQIDSVHGFIRDTLPDGRKAHIIDGHIMTPPNHLPYPRWRIEPRTKADLFNTLDVPSTVSITSGEPLIGSPPCF